MKLFIRTMRKSFDFKVEKDVRKRCFRQQVCDRYIALRAKFNKASNNRLCKMIATEMGCKSSSIYKILSADLGEQYSNYNRNNRNNIYKDEKNRF